LKITWKKVAHQVSLHTYLNTTRTTCEGAITMTLTLLLLLPRLLGVMTTGDYGELVACARNWWRVPLGQGRSIADTFSPFSI